MLGPNPVTVLKRNQEPPLLEATPSTASANGHGIHSQIQGSRCTGRFSGPSATKGFCKPLSRTRRSSTAPISSCPPSTSWCPGDCPTTWVPTQITLILEMPPRPQIPREWTSALILLHLPSLKLELSLEVQFLCLRDLAQGLGLVYLKRAILNSGNACLS